MIRNIIKYIFFIFIVFNTTACQFYVHKQNATLESYSKPKAINHRCDNFEHYNGKVIGDGHCVSLIKHCTGIANTSLWRPGEKVVGNNIEPGTIIATFKKNRYANKSGFHAAIYVSQNENGVVVFDQWQGQPTHKRLIRFENKGIDSNNADSYHVIILERNN